MKSHFLDNCQMLIAPTLQNAENVFSRNALRILHPYVLIQIVNYCRRYQHCLLTTIAGLRELYELAPTKDDDRGEGTGNHA